MHELTPWSNFFVITGSSSAALTGLVFIVITLVAGQERQTTTRDGVEAFSSPTVVHFCAALLISGILTAPWRSLVAPSVLLALTGLYGMVYAARVMARMSRFTKYSADFEDWFWYAVMPLIAYTALLIAALLFVHSTRPMLFVFGGTTMLMIFLGIRNAWDTVTYIAVNAED